MISSRNLLTLSLAGVAVIGAALWLSSREAAGPAPEASSRVLPGLKDRVNTVREVRLSKGDGTHTTLRRGASGWEVVERGFPADGGRVRKLLLDLVALEEQEAKTSDPANYSQIGVEDVSSPRAAGTKIELIEPGRTVSLIVGKPSGGKSGYVRVVGTAQSVLASPQLTPDADPRHWLDSTVIDLPQTRIKQVLVTPGSGPAYTVKRDAASQADFAVPDLPKGRELTSPGAADPVADSLVAVSLEDVRKIPAAEHPADSPRASFRTFNGLTVDVSGRKDGDLRYIRLSAHADTPDAQTEARALGRFEGWELAIPAYKYDAFFRPLDEMLKKPPEPAKSAKAHGRSSPVPTAKASPLKASPIGASPIGASPTGASPTNSPVKASPAAKP